MATGHTSYIVSNPPLIISASYATTASYALNGGGTPSVSASWASSSISASYALTASYVSNSSVVDNSFTSSYLTTSSYNDNSSSFVKNTETSSFVLNSQTSSMSVLTASYSLTASLLLGSVSSANSAVSASWASSSLTASYALSSAGGASTSISWLTLTDVVAVSTSSHTLYTNTSDTTLVRQFTVTNIISGSTTNLRLYLSPSGSAPTSSVNLFLNVNIPSESSLQFESVFGLPLTKSFDSIVGIASQTSSVLFHMLGDRPTSTTQTIFTGPSYVPITASYVSASFVNATTSSSIKTIIFHNTDTVSESISIHKVPSGSSASTTNRLFKVYLDANDTYLWELANTPIMKFTQVSESLQLVTDVANKVTVQVYGEL